MTAPVLFSFGASTSSYATASTTVYGGAMNSSLPATECALAARGGGQGQFKGAGTLSDLNVYVSANARTTDTTYGIELNNSNILSVTYTSGQTGPKTDTSSVAIVADDLLNSYITTSTGSNNISGGSWTLKFVPASGTVSNLFSSGVGTTLTGTGPITAFVSFGGRLTGNPTTTEANAQIYMQHAGTFSYMQMQVVTNTRDTSTIVDLRINGGTVNQTFTYSATQTGKKVDTSLTDAFSTADLVCARLRDTGAGTGSMLISLSGIFTTSTVDGEFMVVTGAATGKSSTTATFGPLGGRLSAVTGTDTAGQQLMSVAVTGSKLWGYCSVNTQTTDFVLTPRKNGAAGNQVLTVAASGNPTGPFQDTTHSDTWAASDYANYSISPPASGTNTMCMISMKLVSDVIPVSSGRRNLALMGVG